MLRLFDNVEKFEEWLKTDYDLPLSAFVLEEDGYRYPLSMNQQYIWGFRLLTIDGALVLEQRVGDVYMPIAYVGDMLFDSEDIALAFKSAHDDDDDIDMTDIDMEGLR